jgi:deazaflavin-dependent oxidoreductase (nitroreductase family)
VTSPTDSGSGPGTHPDGDPGWELASWGKVIVLTTRGRRSGRPRSTPVGFVEEPHGSLLVSASGPETHWARNLLADPRCTVSRAGDERSCEARPLGADEHRAAVVALILRYGTPAERLGEGPSFRLTPLPDADHPRGAGDVHSGTRERAVAPRSAMAGHGHAS